MKKSFLVNALASMFLCSVTTTFTMDGDGIIVCQRPSKEEKKEANPQLIATPKDERDTQKMILMLVGSGAVLAGSHFLADRVGFPDVGNFFNLSRGEFQAACGLSSLFAGIGFIASPEWRPSIRSAAWRFPLMAMLGGLLSHPQVNKGLAYAPLGLGAWFKDNPPVGKPGIGAIYAIGSWYALKPSLDRVENAVSIAFVPKKKNK